MTKLRNAQKFIEQGDKVKMVMQFRGREMSYKDMAMEKFKHFMNELAQSGGIVEAEPKMMGNRLIAIMAPAKAVPTKK